nr:hypothetical protein [Tanacetum cinerariifolium]
MKIHVETNIDLTLNSRGFKRMYVCLGPLEAGYRAARRELLRFDGDFIKAPYTGQILITGGIDSNNEVMQLLNPSVKVCGRGSYQNCPRTLVYTQPQASLSFQTDKRVFYKRYQSFFLQLSTYSMPSDTPVCYLCTCEQCGNILSNGTCLNCNSGTGNSFTYDLIPESFDEVQISHNPPPQCHFNIYLCQICESNSHYGYECSQRVPLVYGLEPCYNDYSHDLPGVNPLIYHHCCYKCGNSLNVFFCHHCTCEFSGNGAHNLEEKRIEEEQAAKAQNSKIPVCYDDDDDYNFAITPNEPVDSLSIGDEHLDTILATESNEFIKSSVENLVPNPSESEGEMSLHDEDISEKIFSNPLFEEEIISMKIDPHHFDAESDLIESLLNRDSSIIPSSSKIDSLLDEFADELTLLKSIPSGIDETDCYPEEDIRLTKKLLYDNSSPRPSEEFVFENSNAEIESFSPSPIPNEDSDSFMEEINLTFTPDDPIPPGIEEDDYDSERDILILDELPSNDTISLPENESFYFDIPSFSRPPAKPPDGNT